jgi:hypothetical protein
MQYLSAAASRRAVLGLAAALLLAGGARAQHATDAGYPRLLGMNIGAKNYDSAAYQDALARLDVVILGFYPGWKGDRDGSTIRNAVRELKRRNPALKVGQYTVLNEASDDRQRAAADRDKIDKLDQEGWWLRSAAGGKQQWSTAHGAWDINITRFAKADANGERYPQWLAKRDAKFYFQRIPDFDIWYFDNVMERSRVGAADWRGNGRDASGRDAELASAFRQAMAEEWETAGKLAPRALLMGNTDSDLSQPEYRGRLQGAFLEGLMGKSWSIESREGWNAMMARYLGVFANLREPKMVGFNVLGRSDDYRFFRYGFASCLLGDGYFSFTEDKAGYSSVAWFDEYDQRIGKAAEPPPRAAWRDGIWRRRYENAMVLVNPERDSRTVTLEPGWHHFKGTQAGDVNDGRPVRELTLAGRDGVLLVRD